MKITETKGPAKTVTFNTNANSTKKKIGNQSQWWKSKSKAELKDGLTGTAEYLKTNQHYRYRQAAIYARLYGNMSLFSFVGSNLSKMDQQTGLPVDRPTFNIIQSCTDTLVARLSQSRPTPVFLTDNGDYKERNLAKQLNNFILGEFYQTKTYDKACLILRDALVEGTGCLHVFRDADDKVAVERVLLTELLIDPNEGIYGDNSPRQLYRIKLVDRSVLMDANPDFKKEIEVAERATVDNSSESNKSVSDLVMVVEGWHLPSGKNAKDGRHTIACSGGVIFDEPYTKDRFPFVFLHYSPRLLGFWAQGLAEQLMGTQLEINSLLFVISRAIKLVGVPRVFVEASSKVNPAHFNSDVGTIVPYIGTKPEFEVAPCVPQELYQQLQRLIQYGYQQCGVSNLQATGEKPAGLNSGEAQRVYDDISSDRSSALSKRYDNLFVDLAYLVIDTAKDICEETGKYATVYPGKDGTKTIDLPKAKLLKDPFVIQCFNMSSLPRDPAGRMEKVVEMIQSGMVTIKEGRRLLDFPDLGQVEKLSNASEERIFQYLDKIVEDGEYNGPDPFLDLQLAGELVVQYYNLYVPAKLEEERAQMLRNWYTQVNALKMAANPPQPATPPGAPAPQQGANPPQANPQPLPQSPLVPNAAGAA
jgi:hypothetical protein